MLPHTFPLSFRVSLCTAFVQPACRFLLLLPCPPAFSGRRAGFYSNLFFSVTDTQTNCMPTLKETSNNTEQYKGGKRNCPQVRRLEAVSVWVSVSCVAVQ